MKCRHYLALFGLFSLLLLGGCASSPESGIGGTLPHRNPASADHTSDLAPSQASAAANKLPASRFWGTDEEIPSGYAQYSYLLLRDENTFPMGERTIVRKRNLELLEMVVALRSAENYIAGGIKTEDINLLIIPIALPHATIDEEQAAVSVTSQQKDREALALFVYLHYDFATATIILHRLDDTSQKRGQPSNLVSSRGPVLFSATASIKRGDTTTLRLYPASAQIQDEERGRIPTFVVQDLSRCPDAVTGLWCQKFIRDTSRPNYWETSAAETLALKIREDFEAWGPELGHTILAFKKFAAIIGLRPGPNE